MNTPETPDHEQRREQFAAAMRRRFPTMTCVVSLSEDTRRVMKAASAAAKKAHRKAQ